jgi:LAO/AO transport system kinase
MHDGADAVAATDAVPPSDDPPSTGERFDARRLAQAISAVERGGSEADALIAAALARLAAGASASQRVVGVTGAPGAGKSSLIAALSDVARAAGRRVAILAVDPSSAITGGALLGDRVRIDERPDDPGRFMRSIATRGSGRALSHTAAAASLLIEAEGFDLIFIETVGAGQADLGIARLADLVLLVEGPEGGDEVQAMKAGLLESAQLIVVNKSDRPGADRAAERLRSGLSLAADAPQVLLASATESRGIAELLAAIDAAAAARAADTSAPPAGRLRRVAAHLVAAAEARLASRLDGAESSGALAALVAAIAAGERPLEGAIDDLLGPGR